MKILIECNSRIPVNKYGGTQRVIWYLGKELTKMGHEISFLVAKGSYCDFARIIEINPDLPIPDQIPVDIDITHFNTYLPFEYKKPYVYTSHGNLAIPQKAPVNTIFVSDNHAKRHDSNSFVYNGLDWDDYGKVDLNRSRKSYHFFGNVSWKVKNVKGAIRIVESLPGEKLEVLGGYRLNFKMGFRFTLNPKIYFRGLVDNVTKKEIIGQSKGLIFPVKWHEPFGLAIIESLYYSSPVYGTPYGSLPELVISDVGYLSNNREDIVNHIKHYGSNYSMKRCHEYAIDNFNSRKMAERYLEKYEIVLNGGTLNDKEPTSTQDYKNCIWIE